MTGEQTDRLERTLDRMDGKLDAVSVEVAGLREWRKTRSCEAHADQLQVLHARVSNEAQARLESDQRLEVQQERRFSGRQLLAALLGSSGGFGLVAWIIRTMDGSQ